MGLSKDLISKFIKTTNDNNSKSKKEDIVYGVIVENGGTKYVKIDGSELLTPITSTADAKNGERVTVMIKNHSAIVTGNVSSPAARTDDVKAAETKILKNSEMIALSASKTSVDALGVRVSTAESTISTMADEISTKVDSTSDEWKKTTKMVQDATGFNWAIETDVTNAKQMAEDAAKTATNFMSYDSTNGLLIGNKTSGSWSGNRAQITGDKFNILDSNGEQLASYGTDTTIGKSSGNNIHIDNDSVDIVQSGEIVASFESDAIYLGKNSVVTKIDLCNGMINIFGEVYDITGSALVMEANGDCIIRSVYKSDGPSKTHISQLEIVEYTATLEAEVAEMRGQDIYIVGDRSAYLTVTDGHIHLDSKNGSIFAVCKSDMHFQANTNVRVQSNTGDVYITGANATLDDNLTLANGSIICEGGNMNPAVTSLVDHINKEMIYARDAADRIIGRLLSRQDTNGDYMVILECSRWLNGSYKYCDIAAAIDNNGNPKYVLSNPTAFRNAIGALGGSGIFPISIGGTGQSGSSVITTIESIAEAAVNFSISAATYEVWGKVATLRLRMVSKNAISSGNIPNVTIATIVDGKRPANGFDMASSDYGASFIIFPSGIIQMQATNLPIPANGAFYVTATYILP